MRAGTVIGCVLLAAAIAGCDRQADIDAPGHHAGGRYQGIGIYPADALWSRLSAGDANKDQTRALRADDGQIIVVVDSRTGEIRQCGNLSGYCVTMNPWSGPLGGDRSAPLSLSKHAADLATENEASVDPQLSKAKVTPKQP
jgi:hypothetical protein